MVTNVIDCWVNVRSPDFVPPFSEKVFAALAKRFPTSVADESYKDAADLVSMMDSAGVTKAVLTDPYDSEPLRLEIERSVADFPDRFIGATAIIPSTAAVDKQRILEFKARGFSVIKVLGVFSDLPYDDPKFFPDLSRLRRRATDGDRKCWSTTCSHFSANAKPDPARCGPRTLP